MISKIMEKNKFLCLIIYRIFLDWHYFVLIYPRHSAFINNRSIGSFIISWLTLLLFFYLTNSLIVHKDTVSSLVLYILFLVSFVPFTTCIYAGMASRGFYFYNLVFWLGLILYWKMLEKTKLRFLKIKPIIVPRSGLFIIVGALSELLIVYISWRYAHLRIITNLLNVYEIRKEASSYTYSTITAYFLEWAVAINPILLGVFYIRKKWVLSVISIIVQMLAFGIDGRKSTFFMPFVVLAILVVYKNYDLYTLKLLILYGVCILCIVGFAEYTLAHSSTISDFGIRRVLIIPNQLGEFYYDFFTRYSPDFFRSSFLRHFGAQSPYLKNGGTGFTFAIGNEYLGSPDDNCSNGLSSDAIANLGSLGSIIMPFFLAVVLRLFDKCSVYLDNRLLIILAIYISYNVLSTSLTACLLTHGFIVLILVIPLLNTAKKGTDRLFLQKVTRTG